MLALVFATYVVAWALLLPAVQSCFSADSECGGNVYRSLYPLQAFLQTGRLLEYADSTTPYTTHPIGYSIVLAATFWISESQPLLPIVVLQLLLLFACGIAVAVILSPLGRGPALTGLALTVFNPNAWFVAVQPRTDMVFGACLAVTLLTAFSYLGRPRLATAVICGISLGLATMVRPVSEHLIYTLPIAFVLLGLLADNRRRPLLALRDGAMAGAVGLALILPWFLHMTANGQGWSLTGWDIRSQWIRDIHATLEFTKRRDAPLSTILLSGYESARRKDMKNEYDRLHSARIAAATAGWHNLSRTQQQKLIAEDRYHQVKQYGLSTHVAAALQNWKWTLLSGGEGELFKALGKEDEIDNLPQDAPLFFWTVKSLFIGFSLSLKALALLGVVGCIVHRRYGVLLLSLIPIVYMMAAHAYYGGPRYRLPIEPCFVILAVFGLEYLRRPWAYVLKHRRFVSAA